MAREDSSARRIRCSSKALPRASSAARRDLPRSLAGGWKYRVERQTNAGALYAKPGELAAHVAFTAAGGVAGAGATLPPVASQAPDVVIRLTAVKDEMRFDLSQITVAPGQLVEIVFANPDLMLHNFVLGAPGSLNVIGEAADRMATNARRGAAAAVRAGTARRPVLDEAGESRRDDHRAVPGAGHTRGNTRTSARSRRTGGR